MMATVSPRPSRYSRANPSASPATRSASARHVVSRQMPSSFERNATRAGRVRARSTSKPGIVLARNASKFMPGGLYRRGSRRDQSSPDPGDYGENLSAGGFRSHVHRRLTGRQRRASHQVVERAAGLVVADELLWIEDDADRILGEVRARKVRVGLVHGGEDVDLQLDAQPVGVAIVHGDR